MLAFSVRFTGAVADARRGRPAGVGQGGTRVCPCGCAHSAPPASVATKGRGGNAASPCVHTGARAATLAARAVQVAARAVQVGAHAVHVGARREAHSPHALRVAGGERRRAQCCGEAVGRAERERTCFRQMARCALPCTVGAAFGRDVKDFASRPSRGRRRPNAGIRGSGAVGPQGGICEKHALHDPTTTHQRPLTRGSLPMSSDSASTSRSHSGGGSETVSVVDSSSSSSSSVCCGVKLSYTIGGPPRGAKTPSRAAASRPSSRSLRHRPHT
eukprot:4616299-Prymnesium_polylepis.3